MSNTTCVVKGCRTGYKSVRMKNKLEGKKNPSIFSMPKDPAMFAKWERKIPKRDRPLTKKDKICSIHFIEDDINRSFQQRMPDGTIWSMPRSSCLLKKEAYPRIFPGYPSYYSDLKPKRKNPAERPMKVIAPVKPKKVKQPTQNPSNVANDVEETAVILDSAKEENQDVQEQNVFNFEMLAENVNDFKLPFRWGYSMMTKAVAFLKWTDDELTNIEKRITITSDLKVKMYVHSKQIFLKDFAEVKSISSIEKLINIVDNMIICRIITAMDEAKKHPVPTGVFIETEN